MYAVDDNVPIPRRTCQQPGRPPSPLVAVLQNLTIGQSVFIAGEGQTNRSRISTAVYKLQERHLKEGWRFTVRKVDGGYRVWRIERPAPDDSAVGVPNGNSIQLRSMPVGSTLYRVGTVRTQKALHSAAAQIRKQRGREHMRWAIKAHKEGYLIKRLS